MKQETAKKLERTLYTTPIKTDKCHRCAIAFTNKYAVTFKHGDVHSSLKDNQKIILYNVIDDKIQIEVVVTFVSNLHDYIVFETVTNEFPDYAYKFDDMYRGQHYFQLGVNYNRCPIWKEGVISKKRRGYFFGTSHGEFGDSGGGIFDVSGQFIGISVAKKDFEFSRRHITGSSIDFSGLADHHPETKIISADVIMSNLKFDDSDSPPPEKKFANESELIMK